MLIVYSVGYFVLEVKKYRQTERGGKRERLREGRGTGREITTTLICVIEIPTTS